jgi:hypothetical protein
MKFYAFIEVPILASSYRQAQELAEEFTKQVARELGLPDGDVRGVWIGARFAWGSGDGMTRRYQDWRASQRGYYKSSPTGRWYLHTPWFSVSYVTGLGVSMSRRHKEEVQVTEVEEADE